MEGNAEILPMTECEGLDDVLERDELKEVQHPRTTEHIAEVTVGPDANDDVSIFLEVCHEQPTKMEY